MSHSLPFPTIEISLAAIARNYSLLTSKLGGKTCAAVVKADAYGLGMAQVAPALYAAGCREFFVATLEEGTELRKMLPQATIYVFHGPFATQAKDFTAHTLVPVLNSLEQIEIWNNAGPAALHIDTGMNRLGLTLKDLASLQPATGNLQLLMSHLACANDTTHPKNKEQLHTFRQALKHFPGIRASFANSSGIFLGKPYHHDLARPGCSLYGISPNTGRKNPMENVVTLSAPVLQYRHMESAQTVGYGGMGRAKKGSVLATVELGYADGLLRSLGNKAYGFAVGKKVPVVGRISMDMVSMDVTAVSAHLRTPDLRITFIGKEQPVDVIAQEAGTIGYEIFTRLGARVKRVYKNDDPMIR
jgi:alanine racemase